MSLACVPLLLIDTVYGWRKKCERGEDVWCQGSDTALYQGRIHILEKIRELAQCRSHGTNPMRTQLLGQSSRSRFASKQRLGGVEHRSRSFSPFSLPHASRNVTVVSLHSSHTQATAREQADGPGVFSATHTHYK
jgi:hypothetical protein